MAGSRPPAIELVEVCPRDGLQNDTAVFPTAAKIELIRRLAATGLRRIEVASFVNPKRVPQMADAEDIAAGVADLQGLRLSALVLNERGFDRAQRCALHEITFVIIASETFSQRNQGASIADTVSTFAALSPRIASAGLKRCVTIGASFGCPFEGEVPLSRVIDIARQAVAIGLDELSLADTIGVATPADVERRFAAVRQAVPGVKLRGHFHDTRNTGVANADAALRSGVQALDASLGGLGGCPFAPGASGNVATEDLVYMLDRDGVRHDGDFLALRDATQWLEATMNGRRLPAKCAHVDPFPTLSG